MLSEPAVGKAFFGRDDILHTLEKRVNALKDGYRQNVALISPLHLADYEFENGKYDIDFSRFDRMVQIFIEECVIGRIEGGHIGTRSSNWTSNFVVFVPVVKPDTIEFEKHAITEEHAQSFYRQFIPGLTAHLEEKGWSNKRFLYQKLMIRSH